MVMSLWFQIFGMLQKYIEKYYHIGSFADLVGCICSSASIKSKGASHIQSNCSTFGPAYTCDIYILTNILTKTVSKWIKCRNCSNFIIPEAWA